MEVLGSILFQLQKGRFLMRQGHLFNTYKTERLTEVHLHTTGNTKKEVTRLNQEIQGFSGQHLLLRVDATSLSLDKILELAVTGRQLLSNLDSRGIIIATFNVQGLGGQITPLSSENERHVMDVGLRELNEWIVDLSNNELLQVFDLLNRKAEAVRRLIDEQCDFCETFFASNGNKEPVKVSQKQNFRFKSFQTDLLTMYEHCFGFSLRVTSPYLSINPSISFQRKLVWPLDKKISFIDSLINDIPIGSFYINSNIHDLELGEGYGKILWDGKQRIHALHSFIMDEFAIEVDGTQVYYSQSPAYFNRLLSNTQVSLFESSYERLPDIIEAYIAINQKQIRHTDEDLEYAQSIINIQS